MADSLVNVNEIFDQLKRRAERQAVPEEFENSFQAMQLPGGDIFGLGPYVAICKKCGAVVYPTALDRHSRFHEENDRG